MRNITHKVKHQYQPTNNTCGYTALAILLSYYGRDYKPEQLVAEVPQPVGPDGTEFGSITAQLADWCQAQGYQTHMFVSDLFILDLSWKDKSSQQIKERLEQVKSKRNIPIMDSHWVKEYEDAYISLIDHGGEVTVVPFITSELINRLLQDGPVLANICSTALRGKGRSISTVENGQHGNKLDDIKGKVGNHSIVIYGVDETGDYLVADPWVGLIKVKPEQMVLAIQAAQIECDNQLLVIKEAGHKP